MSEVPLYVRDAPLGWLMEVRMALSDRCAGPQRSGYGPKAKLLRRNVKRFRGGLAFKAHRLLVSFNSRLESYTEQEVQKHRERDLVRVGAQRFERDGSECYLLQ